MTLLACKLFLRHSELINIKIEDFNLDCSTVSDEGDVSGLLLEVKVFRKTLIVNNDQLIIMISLIGEK